MEITGYRNLTQPEIELINTIKEQAIQLGQMVKALEADQRIDKRWLAIAKTDLQKGFMSLVRSVAQPTTF